jgi:hypothetical protein
MHHVDGSSITTAATVAAPAIATTTGVSSVALLAAVAIASVDVTAAIRGCAVKPTAAPSCSTCVVTTGPCRACDQEQPDACGQQRHDLKTGDQGGQTDDERYKPKHSSRHDDTPRGG